MLPFCYEAGLEKGHTTEAPHFMSIAVDTFIKEVLTEVFSRTRSNGPGESGSAGFGVGTTWIQTHKYRKQLRKEEDAAQRGRIFRDKSGLLPIEAKAVTERGPLGIADIRLALEIADTGMAQFPLLRTQILYGWREGELENMDDYTYVHGRQPTGHVEELPTIGVNGEKSHILQNGHSDAMDIDDEEIPWQGAEDEDMEMFDSILDSCLAAGH